MPGDLERTVGLVTGAAHGIGAGVAERLARRGAQLVLADTDESAGRSVATDLGAHFVRCDVREPEDNTAAVAAAFEQFGGLDLVHLNAGVATGTNLGEDFDIDMYRRAMSVNVDGVVLGAQAALPALRERGGGTIVATASMAGIVPIPLDPIYAATKHAVVGLVRSLGSLWEPEAIRVCGLCPSFADTAIIEDAKPFLDEVGFPILAVDDVLDAFEAVVDRGRPGECWFVVPGREPAPFEFRRAPGPRS